MANTTYKLFAGELSLQKNESEDESLVLPAGDTVKNLYICGALTEVKKGLAGYPARVRIADPTGVFSINCRKERAYCSSEFLNLNIPSFVSVFGDVSIEKRNGKKELYINPQLVREITKNDRDSWILGAAASVIERIENSFESYDNDYGRELLQIAETALSAVKSAASPDSPEDAKALLENETGSKISETIVEIIKENSTKKGVLLDEFYIFCESAGLKRADVKNCIEKLVEDGDVYLPPGGYIKVL